MLWSAANIYGSTGAGQTRTGTASGGHRVTYYVSIQNDAPFAERLRLRGEPSTPNFTIIYRNPAGTNITNQVTAGTYTSPNLASGGTHRIKITVTVRDTAPVTKHRLPAPSPPSPPATRRSRTPSGSSPADLEALALFAERDHDDVVGGGYSPHSSGRLLIRIRIEVDRPSEVRSSVEMAPPILGKGTTP